jgi:hypothetical protein
MVLNDGSLYASAIKLGTGALGSDSSVFLSTTNMGGVSGFFDGTSIKNWRMTVGSNFGVTSNGKLYAKDGEFSGKVTANNGGSIGGWNIVNSTLTRVAEGDDTGNPTWTLGENIVLTHKSGTRYDTYLNFGWYYGSEVVGEKVYPYYGLWTDSNLAFRIGKERTGLLVGGTWRCQGTWTDSNGFSDMRIKNSIGDYTQEYDMFFDNLRPRRYKYNNGTSDRYHTGFIAQEVVGAVESANLTTQDFAGVMLMDPNTKDECWYLRRDEFVSLNTWQIQKLKARTAELEAKVAELEAKLND